MTTHVAHPVTWKQFSILTLGRTGDKKPVVTGLLKADLEVGDIFTGQSYPIMQVTEVLERRDARGNYNNPEEARGLFFKALVRGINIFEAEKIDPQHFKPAAEAERRIAAQKKEEAEKRARSYKKKRR